MSSSVPRRFLPYDVTRRSVQSDSGAEQFSKGPSQRVAFGWRGMGRRNGASNSNDLFGGRSQEMERDPP